MTVKNAAGKSDELKVVAILKTSLDSSVTGSYVDAQTFDGLVGDTAPTVAFIDTKPNAQSETNDAIEALAAQRPDISATGGQLRRAADRARSSTSSSTPSTACS